MPSQTVVSQFDTLTSPAGIAGTAYHYTDEATALLIQRSQLGLPGRPTYLTRTGTLSPVQSQIELALPQRNNASALFEIDLNGLNASRVLREGRVTGNILRRGGGGTEIMYDGPIPLEYVRRIR